MVEPYYPSHERYELIESIKTSNYQCQINRVTSTLISEKPARVHEVIEL